MRRKQCHCVRLVFLIPAVYLLSQTESVWRRYRDLFAKPNRQKFDADCTCPYSPYGDVAGPYRPYGGDVADVDWSIVGESDVDTCHWVANNRRTRGPIQGRHVSLTGWLRSLCKNVGGRGVRPPDLSST
jgi:hypothetical protein